MGPKETHLSYRSFVSETLPEFSERNQLWMKLRTILSLILTLRKGFLNVAAHPGEGILRRARVSVWRCSAYSAEARWAGSGGGGVRGPGCLSLRDHSRTFRNISFQVLAEADGFCGRKRRQNRHFPGDGKSSIEEGDLLPAAAPHPTGPQRGQKQRERKRTEREKSGRGRGETAKWLGLNQRRGGGLQGQTGSRGRDRSPPDPPKQSGVHHLQ